MPFDARVLGGIGVLAAVVEARSFARAATALGLTQSGVSRAVARLEAQVGVRLLQRSCRAVTLNRALAARCLIFLLAALGTGCSGQPSADVPVVPATVEGEAVTLPVVTVTALGATRTALLDTGSSGILISSSLVDAPDDTPILLESLCVGDVCSKTSLWATARDTPFSSPSGIQMVVGMSFLAGQPFEIDHDQRVRVGGLAGDCNVPAIPFVLDSTNRPFLSSLVVDGVMAPNALVDTGSVYTLLAAGDALPAALVAGATPATSCTVDGCTPGYSIVDSPAVCLGGTCAAGVAVKYPTYNGVGNTLLSRFRVRFDFAAKTLRLCDGPSGDDAGALDEDAAVRDGGS